jgi:histidinol-phosphatase
MFPWDNAAIVPCIREAGGKATTVDGKEEDVVWGGSLLTSCGEPLHSELVDVLRPVGGESE